MSRYSRLEESYEENTLWGLYEEAAKRRFGRSILLLNSLSIERQLNNLNFVLSIQSAETEPRETRRTVADVNTKDFTNLSEKEVDETMIKIRKSASETNLTRYTFSGRTGLVWGLGENIGAQVMRLAVGGGGVRVSMGSQQRYRHNESDDFEFSYNQEERITIPPMSQVKVKIVTYLKKYEQNYSLKFSLPANLLIPVCYMTKCQKMFGCCCCASTKRYISPAELCQTLPEYREEGGYVSFIQPGTLSWVGEGSTVHKEVRSL